MVNLGPSRGRMVNRRGLGVSEHIHIWSLFVSVGSEGSSGTGIRSEEEMGGRLGPVWVHPSSSTWVRRLWRWVASLLPLIVTVGG